MPRAEPTTALEGHQRLRVRKGGEKQLQASWRELEWTHPVWHKDPLHWCRIFRMRESYVFRQESRKPACLSSRGILEVSLTAVRRVVTPFGANGLESMHSESNGLFKTDWDCPQSWAESWGNIMGEGVLH